MRRRIETAVPAAPTVEMTENSSEKVSLLFRCQPDAPADQLSVLVMVPDTGSVETVVGRIEPASLRADDVITVSEPAIMRDLRVVRVTFSPDGHGCDAPARARVLSLTLRFSQDPGTNEKRRHLPYVSPAFDRLYRSTV
ncbi:MAG TPA: hypothetical protein VE960_06870, partial [bacterium]|nr:hypothetical protein [bacterium]